jgi:hypothetical protein
MFHFSKSLRCYPYYRLQIPWLERFIFSLLGAFPFEDFFRAFLVELKVFQLRQGLFFSLILSSFILLSITTTLLFIAPLEDDAEFKIGLKALRRLNRSQDGKISLILFHLGFTFACLSVLPIGLESLFQYNPLNFVQEFWIYEELQKLETTLVYAVLWVFQIPVIALGKIYEEFYSNYLPNNLKTVNFFVIVAAAMITPTVDIPTQINFIFIGIFLYLYTYLVGTKNFVIETEILI